MSDISIVDTYSPWLTFSGVLSSTPSIGSPIHDPVTRKLTWSDLILSTGQTGEIKLVFTISGSYISGQIINSVSVDGCNNVCQQEKLTASQSTSFSVQAPFCPIDQPYDLELLKYVGDCSISG